MKRFIILPLIIMALIIGTAIAFEWEGELNPNDFRKWDVINIVSTGKGFVWIHLENPDKNSAIEKVALAVSEKTEKLLAYKYFKLGEPYVYVFNDKLDKYIKYNFTYRERSECIKCHKLNPSI